jgi:1,4-alpha-glucan branching enzyme
MRERAGRQATDAPICIYEVHLGSWQRDADGGWLGYRELGKRLAEHATALGFTHVEFLPVTEHPFYGSWGYQGTGYFAATSRYGGPNDLMAMIDTLHRAGVGVILDWVPSHFAVDAHGLARFDGLPLYEHPDPQRGFHPDWQSAEFDYGRGEVRSFLLSSARFWLERFHVDGLRVDAVASMLYLNYSRDEGEWEPNEFGGSEDLEALEFLRDLNLRVKRDHPDVLMAAEESTAWPGVTRPAWLGGVGFGLKWDMGWMNDTLRYVAEEPRHRPHHQGLLTFRPMYAFSENYVLPLSHDEVVHGKGSLLGRMPGTDEQRFANLRLLLGYQWAQPGKQLLFMGGEFGQWREWGHDSQLEWDLLQWKPHQGMQRWVTELNRLAREEPALHATDFESRTFDWLVAGDAERGVVAFARWGREGDRPVVFVGNFSDRRHRRYRLGLPLGGQWTSLLSSDDTRFGGSGISQGRLVTSSRSANGRADSIVLDLPPLSAVFLGKVTRRSRSPRGGARR